MFGSLQEKKNKVKGNGLVWHEKASRAADEFVITHTHTLLIQTHNMTTVKEIAEQCCQL